MASVCKDFVVDADPEDVWTALRDFGAVHQRLANGFVIECDVQGEDRIITFFNGATVRERLIAIDDARRRLVYSAVESPLGLAHHSASAQVLPEGHGRTRFIWTTDVLPDKAADQIEQMMEQGASAMKQALESDGVKRDDPECS